MSSTITAKVTQSGMHVWRDATPRRAYLSAPHRHLFVVRACVAVGGLDRDVEFHDLGCLTLDAFREAGDIVGDLYDFGGQSCEALARAVTGALQRVGLTVEWVSVSEDDEYTATWKVDA